MKYLFFLLITSFSEVFSQNLSERVDNLEAEAILNIFSFSGSLKGQYFKVTNPNNEKLDLYRLQSSLNVHADISPRLKFNSRYMMGKYFNTLTQERFTILDTRKSLTAAHNYNDSRLHVERAYVDYFLKGTSLAFSIGRLPTFGGSPLHYYDNLPEQSTYPMMAYNAELDGLALTWDMHRTLSSKHSGIIRFIYTPLSHLNYTQIPYYPLDLPTTATNDRKMTSDFIGTFTAEYSYSPQKSFFDQWGVKFFYTSLDDISFPDLVIPADIVNSTPPYSVIRFPDKMMDIRLLSIHNEFRNIAGSGLSLHASILHSYLTTHRLAVLGANTLLGLPERELGFRSEETGTIKGRTYLLTLKQKLSYPKNHHVGLEFLKGDKKAFIPSQLASEEDSTNFYATMGKAWHFFYLWPLEKHLFLRLGYRKQKIDHELNYIGNFGMGSPSPVDNEITSWYSNILIHF